MIKYNNIKNTPHLLLILFVAIIFSGCGGDDTDNNSPITNPDGTRNAFWFSGSWTGYLPMTCAFNPGAQVVIWVSTPVLVDSVLTSGHITKTYAYNGDIRLDPSGENYSASFYDSGYPFADENFITWVVRDLGDGTFNEALEFNISILDAMNGADLEWGPRTGDTKDTLTTLNLFGTIRIGGGQDYLSDHSLTIEKQ